MLIVLALIATVISQIAPLSEPNTLQALLNPEGCNTICWQQLEVGVTTEEEAIQLFEYQNIQYDVGMLAIPDDSWIWTLDEVNPLIDQDQQITVITEFYKEIVWRVWILNANICAAQILESYGTPDAAIVAEVSSGFVLDIYYFDAGVVFSGTSQNAPYFDSAILAQEDFLRRFMSDAQSVTWESISDEYAATCPSPQSLAPETPQP